MSEELPFSPEEPFAVVCFNNAMCAVNVYTREIITSYKFKECATSQWSAFLAAELDCAELNCKESSVNAPPNADQLAAITAFANKCGGNWKARLRELWNHAAAPFELQCMRDSRGPLWLAVFNLEPDQS